MLAFTPAELRTLSELVKNEEHLSTSVKRYIEAIRGVNHQHPIVRYYDQAKTVDGGFVKNLQRMARKSIEMRLGDVDVRRAGDSLNPSRERVSLSALYVDETIQWSANGKFDKSQPVNLAVGMTNEEAEEAVEIPEIHGASRVLLAAELLISQVKIASNEAPVVRYTPIAREPVLLMALNAHRYGRTTQTDIGERKDVTISRPSRYKRAGYLGLTAMMAAAITIPVAHDIFTAQHEAKSASIEAAYLNERDVDIVILSPEDKAKLTDQIEATYPYGSLYAKVVSAEQNAAKSAMHSIGSAITTIVDAESFGYVGQSGISGGIGNVPQDTPERNMWEIQNPSNQPIDGYWSQTVATTLGPHADWVLRGPEHEGFSMSEIKNDPAAFDDKESIVLKGTVNATFYEEFGFAVVPVPVLDGYEVAATNGNGYVVRTSGGGFALGYEEAGQIEVSYVLKQSNKFADDERSILYNPLHSSLSGSNDELNARLFDRELLSSEVRDEWEDAIPNLYELADAEKLQAQVDYIKNGFDYELSPVPKDMQRSIDAGELRIEDFIAGQLREQTANCNVAATMVAASNSQVTPAIGFRNNGDNALTDREIHMWLVDRAGAIYDPTPALKPENTLNNLLNLSDLPYGSSLPRPEVAAAALLGALGLTQRYKVSKGISRAIVGATSAESLRESVQVLDAALYAKSLSLEEPSEYLESMSKDDLLERLAKPQYHDTATKQHVKASAKHLSRKGKRAVGKSSRLLRRVAAIRPIKMPYDNTGVDKVL
jgi:hypothetical protein